MGETAQPVRADSDDRKEDASVNPDPEEVRSIIDEYRERVAALTADRGRRAVTFRGMGDTIGVSGQT